MDKENLDLAMQLFSKLEKNVSKLKDFREQNLPSEFTKLKKECFEIQSQLTSLFK